MGKKARNTTLLTLAIFVALFFTNFMAAKAAGLTPETTKVAEKANQPATSALPKGVEKVTSVEGINEYKLENGLRVLLIPDQSKQTITVNITYLVGSRHEGYGETGMAHLLEHMVFKGTPKHPNIPQELTEHGTRPNGTTWVDRTNYFETFQATEENLDWALDLEADRMVNSFIAKKDLDSEMTVVRNEFESGENDPQGVLLERTISTAFLWHNYGNSTIGARADIENVPIERLQAFYKKYYQPDNAVLIVAGKFDEAKTLEKIHKYFAPIPKPDRQLIHTYTLDPVQDGERFVTLRRVGDIQALCAVYHIPATSHPDYPAVELLTRILGDDTTGRLKKALVDTKKATSVSGFSFRWREPSVAIFAAELKKEDSLEEARELLQKVIEGIASQPVTKEEVDRARAETLKFIELTLNSSQNLCLSLSEAVAAGDWRLIFLQRDRLEKITAEDVNRVAAKYLKTSNRTLGAFIPTQQPDRAEIPETPDVAALLKDYKGKAAVAAGEAFEPSPSNIEARTKRGEASGLKRAFLSKKTRGNTVVVRLSLRFGDEQSLMNRGVAGSFAGQMLMRGTTKHTREQIKEEMDKLKARAFVGGGATSAFVSIDTVRENLPAVMRLVAEVLKEPSFPTNEFEQLKQEELAQLEAQRSEPQFQAFTAISRHFNRYPKGHVRYAKTLEESIEDIKSVTLADAKKFYEDFYGIANGELTVVGDFDEAEIAKLTDELFNGWKSKNSFKRIPDEYKAVEAANLSIETPDKANAFFIARQPISMRDDDPDYPAMILANYMMGGGFLNSRLAVRIRQKEGLSYGVGSQFAADSLDKNANFLAFAIYAPENAGKLEAAFREEIEKVTKDGFTAEEVASAKNGYLQSRQVSRAQDGELAGRLGNYLYLGRTLQWDAEFEKKISELTAEQINAAVRKHIDVSKITIVKAGDFAKTAKK